MTATTTNPKMAFQFQSHARAHERAVECCESDEHGRHFYAVPMGRGFAVQIASAEAEADGSYPLLGWIKVHIAPDSCLFHARPKRDKATGRYYYEDGQEGW